MRISFYDFQDEYDCLYAEFEKLPLKYKVLKKKTMSLEDVLEKLSMTLNIFLIKETYFKLSSSIPKQILNFRSWN